MILFPTSTTDAFATLGEPEGDRNRHSEDDLVTLPGVCFVVVCRIVTKVASCRSWVRERYTLRNRKKLIARHTVAKRISERSGFLFNGMVRKSITFPSPSGSTHSERERQEKSIVKNLKSTVKHFKKVSPATITCNDKSEHVDNTVSGAGSTRDRIELHTNKEVVPGLPQESSICAICFESFSVGEEVIWSRVAPCVHAFHRQCIIPWLLRNEKCPCCRMDYLRVVGKGEISSSSQ
uniref:RING-type domain-containing protein n=1 Tax=Pseudictyota dubia TaxID=2749911 RepID=A0A7R9VRR1_9STRA|mmetsp:Transcript_21128/g.39540  ORF Transcript_21128/g.39540 Transcript_21128/m.39540 type:complete len:236 (+) Transcript_21128:111-818(+)